MELKPGYKQSEIGVIPEDWAITSLGEIAGSIIRGASPRPIDNPIWFDDNSSIGWVRISDVTQSGRFLQKTTQRLSSRGVRHSRFVPSGNLIMSICATVGRPIVTNIDVCIHDGFVVFNRLQVSTQFLYYVLTQLESTWSARGQTGSQMNLNTGIIKRTNILLPHSLPEQEAIAQALSDVDTLIESLEQLIDKKRQVKQGAMQELLTGKRRLPGFCGEWEVYKLRDIGTFYKGRGIKKDDVVPDGIPCVRYGEIYTHYDIYIKKFNSFIPTEIARTSQRIYNGDLLFTGSGETAEEIGKCVAFIGNDEAYAGGDVIIFREKNSDPLYLSYLMNSSSIVVQKARMGQGDAIVHIYPDKLGQIKLKIPSLSEQSAIAEVLKDIDTEIALVEEKLAKARKIKQGMMQELLTGRIRLV